MAINDEQQMIWFGVDPALPDSVAALAYAQQVTVAQWRTDLLVPPKVDHIDILQQQIVELTARLQHMVNRYRESERHNQRLIDQMRRVSDRFDAGNRDGALLAAEIKALKAKYEPAPEPAPNPWGKMFRGGVGSAIERS